MQLIIVQSAGDGLPKEIGVLADEFEEDPHCRLVIVAVGAAGSRLVSVWNDDVATDVESGLREQLRDMVVERSDIIAGLSAWRM